MKKILITGADSYIGTSFEKWISKPRFEGRYLIDTVDMRGDEWRQKDFSGYDTVFHVAGIAHADIGKVTEEQKRLYYRVNCDLAVETAKKAKAEGVKQFIYMSSIIVYGEGTSIRKKRVITRDTKPSPSNFYGDSKWQAEQKLTPLSDEKFHVAILRPPMIYGEGSKGNYPLMAGLAKKLLLFPDIKNERSMLYIGNLCEFVRLLTEKQMGGIYFPQNQEYVKTSEMVRLIAAAHKKKIHIVRSLNWAVYLASYCPGKVGRMINKAFGSLVYQDIEEQYQPGRYQLYQLKASIRMTEREQAHE